MLLRCSKYRKRIFPFGNVPLLLYRSQYDIQRRCKKIYHYYAQYSNTLLCKLGFNWRSNHCPLLLYTIFGKNAY